MRSHRQKKILIKVFTFLRYKWLKVNNKFHLLSKVPVSHKRDIISFDRNIYKAVCLHLRFYCGVDVPMVANEVNKFSLFIGVDHTRI
jgi:hypothetical protein